MPKYSIIIPIYNVEDYILDCARSLALQEYTNYEALFINDGSTDSTPNILRKYIKDNNLKNFYVIDKKNGGVSSARNCGLENSKGEYILSIDSDDFVAPDYLSSIDKRIKKTKPDILIFDFYEYYSEDKIIYKTGISIENKDVIKNCIISAPAQWNKAIKKTLFTKNNITFPKGLIYEDLATTPRLLLHTQKIDYLDKPLYYYRQREKSIMHTIDNKIYNIYSVLELIYNYYKETKNLKKFKSEIEKLYIYNCFFIVNTLSKSNVKNKIKYQREAIKLLKEKYPKWMKNKYLQKENKKTKLHISILKYNKLLPFYNLLRGIAK